MAGRDSDHIASLRTSSPGSWRRKRRCCLVTGSYGRVHAVITELPLWW